VNKKCTGLCGIEVSTRRKELVVDGHDRRKGEWHNSTNEQCTDEPTESSAEKPSNEPTCQAQQRKGCL
jgi:hypothetical protein